MKNNFTFEVRESTTVTFGPKEFSEFVNKLSKYKNKIEVLNIEISQGHIYISGWMKNKQQILGEKFDFNVRN